MMGKSWPLGMICCPATELVFHEPIRSDQKNKIKIKDGHIHPSRVAVVALQVILNNGWPK